MRYAEARPLIRTGDLIAVRATHGGLPAVTRWVTRSPYTHTAVALWGGFRGVERLLVAQTNGAGCGLAPLSHFARTDFDVFDCPVDRGAAEQAVWALLGTRIRYDLADLARIAAHRLLGWPLPPADDGRLICSALSASIYLHAGWAPARLPSIPAPDDVVAALGAAPRIEVRP